MALIQCQFYSQVLGLMSTMSVILPDPPAPEAAVPPTNERPPYPTLYLLHGLSDDHTAWLRRTSIERHVAGLNLAVVMPAVQRIGPSSAKKSQHWRITFSPSPHGARRPMWPACPWAAMERSSWP